MDCVRGDGQYAVGRCAQKVWAGDLDWGVIRSLKLWDRVRSQRRGYRPEEGLGFPPRTPTFRMGIGRVASSLESQRQEGESSRAVSMIL